MTERTKDWYGGHSAAWIDVATALGLAPEEATVERLALMRAGAAGLPPNARVLTPTEWNDLIEEQDEERTRLTAERDEAIGALAEMREAKEALDLARRAAEPLHSRETSAAVGRALARFEAALAANPADLSAQRDARVRRAALEEAAAKAEALGHLPVMGWLSSLADTAAEEGSAP